MSTATVDVRRALASQEELRRRQEHAAAHPALLLQLGLEPGRQVLLQRDDGDFALYTLVENDGAEDRVDIVRMGAAARARLDGPDQFGATVDTSVIDPTATEDDARRGLELIERLVDDGSTELVVIAPHGGDIEVDTDAQALQVRRSLADLAPSCWFCQGWKPGGGALERWHITSTDITSSSFPLLGSIAARGFRHAVSFHGFDGMGRRPDIVVGGAAPQALRQVMAATIAQAVAGRGLSVAVAGDDDPRGGHEAANLVNRLTTSKANGIQIEQQLRARREAWADIADAVALVYQAVLTG